MKTILKTNLKIGDKIKIISGNNKGLIGNITTILKKESTVTIEGIPPRIRKMKSSQGEKPKDITLEIQIHISNVMLWDTDMNKPSKIGFKFIDGKKIRYLKKSGKIV